MKCKDAEPHLEAVADGETRGRLMSHVLKHLEGCSQCQAHLERLKGVKSLIQGRLRRNEAPAALQESIRSQIRAPQPQTARPFLWSSRPLQMAAVLAIVFVVGWAVFQYGLDGSESEALAAHSERVVHCHQANVTGQEMDSTQYYYTSNPVELRKWLVSHPVDHQVGVPTPAGLRVIGGTYRYYDANPVSCVMYDGDEKVCFFTMKGEPTDVAGENTFTLEDGTTVYYRHFQEDGASSDEAFNVMIWLENDIYYSLVSSAPEDKLATYVGQFRRLLT